MKGNTGLRVNMLTSLTNVAIIVICDVDPLPAVAIINKKYNNCLSISTNVQNIVNEGARKAMKDCLSAF